MCPNCMHTKLLCNGRMAGAVNKLSEVEERLRRAEDSGKENKSALRWLP